MSSPAEQIPPDPSPPSTPCAADEATAAGDTDLDGVLSEAFRARVPLGAAADDDFGAYRLLRTLGRGGMGQVFFAQQVEPVQRQVALKVLRTGFDSPTLLRRFAAEQQALAKMNHDHIAKVFDAGRSRAGRPFFAMEYVDGVPLTTHCDCRRLGTEQRLRLFLDVCAGVAHAHENGVLHRDLKPGNILVAMQGERAVVKLIDFGLARLLDPNPAEHPGATRHGVVLGTPDYMSPEQASGASELDARTDVFSLGVVLYELLTGVRPFADLERLGPLEVQRRIVTTDPPSPSARVSRLGDVGRVAELRGTAPRPLTRRLRGDLDCIVMRALEKSPDRRYPSVAALRDDVQAFLASRPVVARRASLALRVRKWVVRNRALALGLGVGGAALAVAAFTLWHAWGFWSAGKQDQTRIAAQVEATQDGLRLLGEAVQEIVVADRLTAMPYDAQRSVLELAVQLNRQRVAQSGTDPALRQDVAKANVEIGTALLRLGRAAEAAQALQAADEELRGASTAELVAWRGRTRDGLASLAYERSDLPTSARLRETAIADLRAAAAQQPSATTSAWLATTLGNAVDTLYALGKHAAALRCADEQIAKLEELGGAAAAAIPVAAVIRAHYVRGLALNGVGQFEAARDALARAAQLGEEHAPLDRDARFMQAVSWRLLARMLQKLDRDRDRGPPGDYARRALAAFESLAKEFPEAAAYHDGIANTRFLLAEFRRHAGAAAEALADYEAGLAAGCQALSLSPHHPGYLASARACLAYAGRVTGPLGVAREFAARAQELSARVPVLTIAAAKVIAVASGSVRIDERLPQAQRIADADALAGAAVALLRARSGEVTANVLIGGSEFDAIRRRADFNGLLLRTTSLLDDREAAEFVEARWVGDASAGDLEELERAGFRITDFEVERAEPLRLAAAMVRNVGGYKRETALLVASEAKGVMATCAKRKARTLDLAALGDGAPVVAVLCQQSDVIGWIPCPDITLERLQATSDKNFGRPVSLSVVPGSNGERFSATIVGNHLWDWREWRLLQRVGEAELDQEVRSGWNVHDLTRRPDGSLAAVIVRAPAGSAGQSLLFGADAARLQAELLRQQARVAAFGTFERDGRRSYDAVLQPNRRR